VCVEPGELGVELIGAERRRAEHPEAAGVGDRRDHVAAVAETEQREVDPEQIGEAVVHAAGAAIPRFA
jgi:hypothetical protein